MAYGHARSLLRIETDILRDAGAHPPDAAENGAHGSPIRYALCADSSQQVGHVAEQSSPPLVVCPSVVSRMLKSMELLGYVNRDYVTRDKRQRWVELTYEGAPASSGRFGNSSDGVISTLRCIRCSSRSSGTTNGARSSRFRKPKASCERSGMDSVTQRGPITRGGSKGGCPDCGQALNPCEARRPRVPAHTSFSSEPNCRA
jgi:hypothetical protein